MKLKLKQAFLGVALIGLLAGGMTSEAADKVDFEKQIWPIIERSCLKCHKAPYKDAKTGRTKKPKGDLRVDKPDLLMTGSEEGKVIIPGKPEKSSFYTLTTLGEDHDDIMPSKGDPLTKAEQELLKKWITEGADFGGWKGWDGKESASAAPKKAPSRIEIIAEGVKPAADSVLASFRGAGVLAMPLARKHPLVRVDFSRVSAKVADAHLKSLERLKTQLTDLNLAGSKVTDAGMKQVATFKNLTRLHLENTGITDAGLAHLSGLKNLEYLNLYGTKVTDAGLKSLTKMIHLRKVFVWQTEVTPEGAAALKKQLVGGDVILGGVSRVKVADAVAATFFKGGCCDKAHAAGTACSRTCCMAASAAGAGCVLCNVSDADQAAGKELTVLFVKDGCCGKAHAGGKTCDHKCCVAAAEKSELCLKCNEASAAGFKAIQVKREKAVVDAARRLELVLLFDEGSCCQKEHAKNKVCGHGCCKSASGKNEVCLKCNKKSGEAMKALKAKWAEAEKAAKSG